MYTQISQHANIITYLVNITSYHSMQIYHTFKFLNYKTLHLNLLILKVNQVKLNS